MFRSRHGNIAMNPPPLSSDDGQLSPDSASPPSALESLFVGRNMLGPVTRFLIYVIAAYLLIEFSDGALGAFASTMRHQPSILWLFLFQECARVVVALGLGFIACKYERCAFGDYGLPRRGAFGKLFWIGLAWGFLSISVLLFAMKLIGVFDLGGVVLRVPRILKFAVFWAVLFILVGFFEESVTRGYTQFTLAQGIGFWPAAIVLSIGFGAIHLSNPGEGWVGALCTATIGLFFCLTLRRTGTLWFAIGMHAAWDWGETFFYSVPDSGITAPGHLLKSSFHGPRWLTGGSVGPEGSLLVFVLIGILFVLFNYVYPEVKYGRVEAMHADSSEETAVPEAAP